MRQIYGNYKIQIEFFYTEQECQDPRKEGNRRA